MFYFEREMACVTSKADQLKAALKKADKNLGWDFCIPKVTSCLWRNTWLDETP